MELAFLSNRLSWTSFRFQSGLSQPQEQHMLPRDLPSKRRLCVACGNKGDNSSWHELMRVLCSLVFSDKLGNSFPSLWSHHLTIKYISICMWFIGWSFPPTSFSPSFPMFLLYLEPQGHRTNIHPECNALRIPSCHETRPAWMGRLYWPLILCRICRLTCWGRSLPLLQKYKGPLVRCGVLSL